MRRGSASENQAVNLYNVSTHLDTGDGRRLTSTFMHEINKRKKQHHTLSTRNLGAVYKDIIDQM